MFSYIRGRHGGLQHRGCLYTPILPYAPHHSCTSVCSPIPYVPHMSLRLGGQLYTPYVLGVLGASVHLSGISVPRYIHLLLSLEQSNQLFPIIVGCFLLVRTSMDVCYALCCCSFHSHALIMSQASTTMAMTTTSLVTEVCSLPSSLPSMATMTLSLMGLPATSGQHDVVLPPLLTPRHSVGVLGLASVPQQQPQSHMPLQGYANCAMDPEQIVSLLELTLPLFCIFICLVSVLVYAFCFQVPCWMLYLPMGAQALGFAPLQPFGAYPWQAYVQPGDHHCPHQVFTEWLLPPCH